VGTKTIGVAVTDAIGLMAHPVCTITRRSVARDAEEVARIARERGVERIAVGLPLELDGSEQRSARLARQVGVRVGEVTALPIDYVDERFPSVDATVRLFEAGLSRERRKQVIDQQAAVEILERWLAGADRLGRGDR
jgi:putative Holliday junction resolvase